MKDIDLICSCFIETSINCRGSTSTSLQSSMLVATYPRWTNIPQIAKLILEDRIVTHAHDVVMEQVFQEVDTH